MMKIHVRTASLAVTSQKNGLGEEATEILEKLKKEL